MLVAEVEEAFSRAVIGGVVDAWTRTPGRPQPWAVQWNREAGVRRYSDTEAAACADAIFAIERSVAAALREIEHGS